ncbi:MAG: hypothetical protein HY901_09270 [Deltaproteobacteria bacterium]|nr:hypothetical protein [Deltaproteobacteria bacterium]
MSRFSTWLIAVSFALAGTTGVHANPVAIEDIRLRQVPHTRDVQITYVRYDSTFDLKGLTRDNQPIPAGWVSGTYRTNMGSGVVSSQARQACDCSVPVGQHLWAVANGDDRIAANLTVVADLSDLTIPDAGGSFDVLPWEQPDPVEFQGIDCAQVCLARSSDASLPPPGLDASAAAPGPDAGPAASLDAASLSTPGESGCSQGLSPFAFGSISVALVALAGLALRRRRG